MYIIKIKHNDIGLTEYPVYLSDEATEKDIDFEYWQKAEEGDYALTDDGYVAKVA